MSAASVSVTVVNASPPPIWYHAPDVADGSVVVITRVTQPGVTQP